MRLFSLVAIGCQSLFSMLCLRMVVMNCMDCDDCDVCFTYATYAIIASIWIAEIRSPLIYVVFFLFFYLSQEINLNQEHCGSTRLLHIFLAKNKVEEILVLVIVFYFSICLAIQTRSLSYNTWLCHYPSHRRFCGVSFCWLKDLPSRRLICRWEQREQCVFLLYFYCR